MFGKHLQPLVTELVSLQRLQSRQTKPLKEDESFNTFIGKRISTNYVYSPLKMVSSVCSRYILFMHVSDSLFIPLTRLTRSSSSDLILWSCFIFLSYKGKY